MDHPPFFLVKFRYPSDEEKKRLLAANAQVVEQDAARADKILASAEKNGPRNFAYSVQGEADFEPVEVFDNGKVTTMRFKGTVEMPAIYLSRDDGTEELVPKNVNGELVLIHARAKKFVLRRGSEVMCVFNENFVPDGLEPRTKTTSPTVARVVKRTAPVVSSGRDGGTRSSATSSLSLAPRAQTAAPLGVKPMSAPTQQGGHQGASEAPPMQVPASAPRSMAAVPQDVNLIATGSAGLPVGK
jgi:hypothetical protein